MLLGFLQGTTMAAILTEWHWKHYQQIPWKLNLSFNGNQYGLNSLELFQGNEGGILVSY